MKTSTTKWLLAVPGKKKLYILALTIIQAIHGASGVLYALLLRGLVDSAVEKNADGFFKWLILTIILVLVQICLRALIRWLSELSKATIENIFKERLTNTILKKDFLHVSAVHSGEWLNRLTNDTQVVARGYVEIVPGIVGMLIKLISALIMIIALEPRFAFILIPCGVILIVLTWLFRKYMKRLHKKVQEADGRLRVFLQEHIGSLLMIRSFAVEEQTSEGASKKMQEHKKERMRRNYFSNFANTGFGLVMNAMYLLGIGWCGYGILIGTISFGTLTAITQLISQIQTPFANISGYIPRYYTMIASAERLMEAEAFKEDNEETDKEPKSLEKMQNFYKESLETFGLEEVSFKYYPAVETIENLSKENMPEVVSGLNLSIKKGEYVAFTGHSGCGKSTVLKLMMCVYEPDKGKRYFKTKEGEKKELTSEYRRMFAYVPQGNCLMNGTIKEVVSFANPLETINEEKLEEALKIACAKEFVAELDKGVDTLLGERGAGLSEGQMQRLAIARAIYSNRPVILLDEATSALDSKTEKQLLENLKSMTEKTVLIVTHRTAALKICDRVIQFAEGGKIKDE